MTAGNGKPRVVDKRTAFYVALLTALMTFTTTHAADISLTKTLYSTKLSGYDVRIRPRMDQANAVNLASQFIPTNIIEFETTEQRFTVLGYLELAWTDEMLQWEQDGPYGEIKAMKVPINQMWTPSIILSKAFEGSGVVGDADSDVATVTFEGEVTWAPEGTFSFVCEVDIKYYPFDEQLCVLTYYVSDETVNSVVLSHNGSVTLDRFIQNSEWDLVEVSQTVTHKYEANFININFQVQRRASFTTYTVITPLLMLAFLNVCVFLVPIDSGEKGSFAITIFLSYGIFVTIVSDTLPHNSLQISYFVLFLIVLLLLSVLSVFYTIMQAKVFAAYGDELCNFHLCCKKKSKRKEKTTDDDQRGNIDNGVFFVRTPSEKIELQDMEKDENYHQNQAGDGIEKKGKGDEVEGGGKAMDDEENPRTWRWFLEKLDTCLFLAFFTLVTAATTVFFALMMQRFGINKMDFIK